MKNNISEKGIIVKELKKFVICLIIYTLPLSEALEIEKNKFKKPYKDLDENN